MKPLNELTNEEKAHMLHELFPGEMPQCIAFIQAMAETIIEHADMHRRNWEEGAITFDFWLSLAETTGKCIGKEGDALATDSKHFAGKLFEGYNALFVVDCLLKFTQIRRHPNQKFAQAVDLLFNDTHTLSK